MKTHQRSARRAWTRLAAAAIALAPFTTATGAEANAKATKSPEQTAKAEEQRYIDTAAQAPEAEFNVEWFTRFVRPMKRELGDMPPLMAWTLPVPPNHRLYEPRFRERFEKALPKILERGFVPTVVVWEGRGGLTGPILMAKMIQDAGGEVHLEYRGLPGGEEKLYESCELWVDSPDNRAGRRENRWPCMIHADPTYAREWIRDAMKQFQSAGVTVDGMWFDFEPMPTPFGGALRAQRKDPRIAAQYPEGVLDDRRKFVTFIEQYECELFSEAMADPVHAVFPDALVGNYENVASSAEYPYLNRVDDVDLIRLDASMVTLYPDNWVLRNHFGKDPKGPPIPRDEADDVFWAGMMWRLAGATPNEAPDKITLTYVTRMVQMFNSERHRIPMGKNLYRELLRHVWLRGVDRMFLFNRGHTTNPRFDWQQRANESFEEVEDARAVYDEMLAFREFLKHGEPMNHERHKPFTGKPYWSGLELDDRALVRATSRDGETRTVEVSAFGDQRFELDAVPEGRFYLLSADGSAEIVTADGYDP